MEHDPTLDEVLKRLEAAVAKAPAGGWIEGEIGGVVLADPASTRATLDRVSGSHPVYLHAWTGHGVIVNTAALRALKIRDDEPDPPGGRFARAGDGRTISGLAEEYACYLVARRLSLLTDSTARARGFAGFASEAASLGITSAQAMTTSFPLDATLEALRGGDLPLRLRLIDFPFTAMSQWTAAPAPAAASPLVSVSGTKWILDGTPLERLMFVRQPYSDRRRSAAAPTSRTATCARSSPGRLRRVSSRCSMPPGMRRSPPCSTRSKRPAATGGNRCGRASSMATCSTPPSSRAPSAWA